MKIFLTGASGMLAAATIPVLKSQGHELVLTDARLRLPDIMKGDVSDFEAIRKLIIEANPDFVFHFAAETNVDLCEQDPDHAYRINTTGTENIALTCQQADIPLLYISTGAVFRGDQREPYTEFDTPNPPNVYGDSKWQGEKIVTSLLTRYFIFRAGWMIGGWEIDKKFVYKIVQQLKEGKRELKVVSDKFGSPTFTADFGAQIPKVVTTGRYGVYHMTNKGTASRLDLAEKIVEYMGLEGQVTIVPVNSAQFPLPAPRGDSEMMTNYKLELIGLNTMPHWTDSLKNYIISNKDK